MEALISSKLATLITTVIYVRPKLKVVMYWYTEECMTVQLNPNSQALLLANRIVSTSNNTIVIQ